MAAQKKEDLIDVGEEDEIATDVELENTNDDEDIALIDDNPNIADQLDNAGISSDDSDELDTRTPKEKLQEYLDANEEAAQYSQDVQKRINKLTYDRHEAERREKAALEYAQGVQSENANLKTRQQHQDGVFINEHKTRIKAELEAATQQYKEAYGTEDIELIAEANQNIAKYAAELAQAEQTESRFNRHVSRTPPPNQNVQPWQAPPIKQADTPAPDVKAEEWATRNEWFGEDETMTDAVMQIHESLVSKEGFLPTGEAYYAELDSRMRKNFPSKFKVPKMNGSAIVTGSSNAPSGQRKGGKKKVKLSASQVAIAKKLGVPLAEYAKYV